MEQPTKKNNYTKKDLVNYAQWRKDEEFKDLAKINDWQEKNQDKNKEDCEHYREPLAITITKVVKVELSTGGDADGFLLEFDKNNLTGGKYYWADWGVYEEVNLTDEETEQIFNNYLYGDTSFLDN